METKMFKINARCDDHIQLKVFPGHFATPQSHITHYLDITTIKARSSEARRVAEAVAANYQATTPVDTIVCMDGLEVVGAYLAEELSKVGVISMNSHQAIYVTAPENNGLGQLIFRDNTQMMIRGKNILILNGSVTTGETLSKVIHTILYYGGKISGIAAIFSAVRSVAQLPVHSIFEQKDIPNYETYRVHDCPLCKNRQKLDAMVNGYGYSKI